MIVVVGLDERSESEGLDRFTMAIPQVQNDLVDALTATGKPVIIVLVVVNLVLPGYVTALCQGWGMNAGVAGTIASVVNTLLAVIVSYPLLKFWIMPKNK